MIIAKQAKILTKPPMEAIPAFLTSTRDPARNRVIFLLSVKVGLRAKKIASLTWTTVTDGEGLLADTISLTDIASKGRGGRVIPIGKDLKAAFVALKAEADRMTYPSPLSLPWS